MWEAPNKTLLINLLSAVRVCMLKIHTSNNMCVCVRLKLAGLQLFFFSLRKMKGDWVLMFLSFASPSSPILSLSLNSSSIQGQVKDRVRGGHPLLQVADPYYPLTT